MNNYTLEVNIRGQNDLPALCSFAPVFLTRAKRGQNNLPGLNHCRTNTYNNAGKTRAGNKGDKEERGQTCIYVVYATCPRYFHPSPEQGQKQISTLENKNEKKS